MDGTLGTDGTHSGGVIKDSYHSDNAGNGENEGRINENTKIIIRNLIITVNLLHMPPHIPTMCPSVSCVLITGEEETPPWVRENRSWTHDEAEAFKAEVAAAMRSKAVADSAAANEAGTGIIGNRHQKDIV